MSVAEDTTHIPEVIVADAVAAAIVSDLQSTISNTFEAPLNLVSETSKLAEETTKTILEESQAVIDETTKLIEEITTTMVGKSDAIVEETTKVVDETTKTIVDETTKLVDETTKAIVSEGLSIVGEATMLVDSAFKSAENISNIISEEEKRLTETISRLSIEMGQETKKATGLFAKIHNFVKLITSCTHRANKSVVKVSTADVDVKVNAV
jgi:hypothetical protein